MAAGGFVKHGAAWARGFAVAAAAIFLALAPLSPAGAKPAKQTTAKTAAAAPAKKAAGKKPAYAAKSTAAKSTAAKKPKAGAGRGKAARPSRGKLARAKAPERPSFSPVAGRHAAAGDLPMLRSSVALVIDQDTQEVLVSKNDRAVLPIASLTKLMTGLVISQAGLPLDEPIAITQGDVDTGKRSRSRLAVGARLTRGELLQLALMSSENRAAHALGRTYPGGMERFVSLMNARAMTLGMRDTHYAEPTGLSSANRSSARDLATLVAAASQDPLLRQLTTSPDYEVAVGQRVLQYSNTNRLVRNPGWHIGVQKTGYITEAGQCLVMQARVAGRKLIMVFLDSTGKFSRIADAERVRNWVELRRHANIVAGNGWAGG